MRMTKLLLGIIILFSHVKSVYSNDKEHSGYEKYVFTEFSELPPLKDHLKNPGLAGPFSGIIGEEIIIAGGANFPDKAPWEGGEKIYWNDIYVCSTDTSNKEWKIIPGMFPEKLAYGFSVTLPEGILCVGGNDAQRTYDEVFLMKYNGAEFSFEDWPSLPVPLANMCGAFIDGSIYIAGGIEDLAAPASTNHFFVLDTENRSKGWTRLPSWPGKPKAYAVAAGQNDGFDNCFYLFGGRNMVPGKPWDAHTDGYVYNPRLKTWSRLDTPEGPFFPVMAGTAASTGAHHIILFGGSDGKLAKRETDLKRRIEEMSGKNTGGIYNDSIRILNEQIVSHLENHPGFSRDLLLYHTITNTAIKIASAPMNIPVTTNVLSQGNQFFLTSGELRPGVRMPEIISIEQVRTTEPFGLLNSFVTIIYFGVLIFMGWFFSRRQKTSNDYFRSGGRVPWWVAGMSIFGTALSSITFMAIPAKAYATDWSYIWLNAGIILVAPLIIWLFIPFYRKLNITTAYEYIEKRFNLLIRMICSVTYILYQIGRMGIVILLPSIAINVVVGIDIFVCIGLIGVISLVYTMMGGIEAVVWSDAMQVVVLLGGALLAIIFIAVNIDGGLATLFAQGAEHGKFHTASTDWDLKNPTLWTVLIATLFMKTTEYGSDQTLVQRYLTTKDVKTASDGVWMNAALTVPATIIFFFIGTCLYGFYKASPELLSATVSDPDAIFPWYIINSLPKGISGLLIAGIFAAAMSTLSSSMNSSATAYCVDIHFRFGLSKHNQLSVARIVTMITGLSGIAFSVMMATWNIASLWDEMSKIVGLVLGGMGGLFLLGLLTKRANSAGALIGLACSVIVQIIVSRTGAVHLLLYATTGFISSFGIGYLASLVIRSDSKDISGLTVSRN